MSRIVYGYRIQDGAMVIQHQEAEAVKQIFGLYLEGMTAQKIAEILNESGLLYNSEDSRWDRHRVIRMLRDPHYTGTEGYPGLLDDKTFRTAQETLENRARKRGDHPALCLVKMLRCANCGSSLRRISERQWRNTLHFLCDQCGAKATISDTALLAEIERQAAEYTPPKAASEPYDPSGETIRLTNAINRGLERPDEPEKLVALILRGISARYDCVSTQTTAADLLRLIREKAYEQAICSIAISPDNTITVTFQ